MLSRQRCRGAFIAIDDGPQNRRVLFPGACLPRRIGWREQHRRSVDDEVVGGIGLSGGNGEQDTQCGVAALQGPQELLGDHRVLVAADIKK